MSPVAGSSQANPTPIIDAAFAFGRTQVLVSAVELDVFTHIDNGQHTVAELAPALHVDPRGLRMLLDALTSQEFLTKQGDRYHLTETSRTFLSRNSPSCMGGWTLHMVQIQPGWSKLTESVRTGRPPRDIHGSEDQGEFFSQFVHTLHALGAPAAEKVAQQTLSQLPRNQELRVLDVGAGSGVWGFAFAKLNPKVRVTIADWPKVIDNVTKKFVKQYDIADRVDYIPGDFREADFGESRYDVATLGHICHGLGPDESQKLFSALRRALKPGGHLVIADFLPDEQRAQAELPLLFAINMLVHTEQGDVFTFSEYRQWLLDAGFEEVKKVDVPGAAALLVANKRAAIEKAA